MSMFGALNRFIARLDAEPQGERNNGGDNGAWGFQILRNTNDTLPLEPWFDFIIGINGRTIDNPDPTLFAKEVRNSAGTTISLGIWSAKGQRIRELYVPIPAENPTLGLSLQWTPLSSTDDVWHILDVSPNSPADIAGLLPYGDYIIGSPEGLVKGESGLGELVEDYANRPLRLFVYNHEYNVTRPVTITPSRSWGGQGLLGCVLGFGALHRLPAPLEEPPAGPGETLFDGSDPNVTATQYTTSGTAPAPAQNGFEPAPLTPSSFFVPADAMPASSSRASPAPHSASNTNTPPPGTTLAPPPPPSSSSSTAPPPARRSKARLNHAASSRGGAGGIDEYFAEGEAKSRELDYGSGSSSGSRPPPPKAGPPPRAGGPGAGAGPPPGPPPKDAAESKPGSPPSVEEEKALFENGEGEVELNEKTG
ncbi:GRASP55/65 PDZ-like domain-containing protein [Phyllosticta citrichinensis]|uniref:GRASP55/65 PDZ-like domain-containing protein n=1 Tax=Phyllosticta citrichinensis TaxID=1130410 RepID=A0ABR1XSE0_9PEZI